MTVGGFISVLEGNNKSTHHKQLEKIDNNSS